MQHEQRLASGSKRRIGSGEERRRLHGQCGPRVLQQLRDVRCAPAAQRTQQRDRR
jgi:hypothetical protein